MYNVENFIAPECQFGRLINVRDNTDWDGALTETPPRLGFRYVTFPIENWISFTFLNKEEDLKYVLHFKTFNFTGSAHKEIMQGTDHKTKSFLLHMQNYLNNLLFDNLIQLDICKQIEKLGDVSNYPFNDPSIFLDGFKFKMSHIEFIESNKDDLYELACTTLSTIPLGV